MFERTVTLLHQLHRRPIPPERELTAAEKHVASWRYCEAPYWHYKEPPRNPDMPWTLLITILKDLLTLCFADTSIPEAERTARARAAVKRPSPVQQWQYERKIREKMGLSLKEWRQQREKILGTLYEDLALLPDAEVDALIADAKAVDWTI